MSAMKHTVFIVIASVWMWSYYRVILLTNKYLRELFSISTDIERYASPRGRLRLLLVAPIVYAKIVFSTVRDAIVCYFALFLVWWYDRKGKKEDEV